MAADSGAAQHFAAFQIDAGDRSPRWPLGAERSARWGAAVAAARSAALSAVVVAASGSPGVWASAAATAPVAGSEVQDAMVAVGWPAAVGVAGSRVEHASAVVIAAVADVTEFGVAAVPALAIAVFVPALAGNFPAGGRHKLACGGPPASPWRRLAVA